MMACRTFISFINRFVLAQSRYEVLLGLFHKLVCALSVGRCHLKEVGTVGQVGNRQCGALCVARNGVAQEGRTAEVVNHERSAGFQWAFHRDGSSGGADAQIVGGVHASD